MQFLAAPSPAVGPALDSVQRRAAVDAGVTPGSVGAQFCRRSDEVRARQISRRSGEFSASGRCNSKDTNGGNQEIHKAEKNTVQGAFTLLSYPMYCAPRHVRVLRSPRSPSSHSYRVPRLSYFSRQFYDLGVFKQGRSCAPRGRPLQLSTRSNQQPIYNVQCKVLPEPSQIQQLLPSPGDASSHR